MGTVCQERLEQVVVALAFLESFFVSSRIGSKVWEAEGYEEDFLSKIFIAIH